MTRTFRADESIALSSSIVMRGTSGATKVGVCPLVASAKDNGVGVGVTVGGGAFVGTSGVSVRGAVSVGVAGAR